MHTYRLTPLTPLMIITHPVIEFVNEKKISYFVNRDNNIHQKSIRLITCILSFVSLFFFLFFLSSTLMNTDSILSNKQLSRKCHRSCADNCSQERAKKKKEKTRTRTYRELIRCHCLGSNLTLVYNLRYSLFVFFLLILYPICVLVIFISYSYYNHLRRCRLLFIDAGRQKQH